MWVRPLHALLDYAADPGEGGVHSHTNMTGLIIVGVVVLSLVGLLGYVLWWVGTNQREGANDEPSDLQRIPRFIVFVISLSLYLSLPIYLYYCLLFSPPNTC